MYLTESVFADRRLFYYFYFYCLRTFLSLFEFEHYVLILFEAAKTLLVDACVMNKNIVAGLGRDKAITLG